MACASFAERHRAQPPSTRECDALEHPGIYVPHRDVTVRLARVNAAHMHYRTLFGHARTTDAAIERAVDALIQGIAADKAPKRK